VKRHTSIYLLAVALAGASFAALLSACAPDIKETEPNFAVHAHVTLGQRDFSKPGVYIASIYRTTAPNNPYTPSSTALDLWLHSGDYVAKIERCNQSANDPDLVKYGHPLGRDHLFEFSVETNQLYHLRCTTGPDGTIYMQLEKPLEVVG
jgi:hypothetical protein